MSREMKARWEYAECCCGLEYWGRMKDDLMLKLESKYMENRIMGMYEKEYGEFDWYEWHFDTMFQFHYFYDTNGRRRNTERAIRRIEVLRTRREVKATWEYVDFWRGLEYWASMDDDLTFELESIYMDMPTIEIYEKVYGESEKYEWDFDKMIQVHEFCEKNGRRRKTERAIRRIKVLHCPYSENAGGV